MSKIWRLNYKQFYGNRGNYWMKTVDIHDEERFNREIKKLKDGEGTIEIFESTEKIDIQSYVSSIMRDNQLDSILVVADEKSTLYSNFKELLSNSKTVDGNDDSRGYSKKYLKVLIDEWDFLKKSDDALVKKFFAKYRTYLLNYANDSYEWYETLLQVYNYADIKKVEVSDWAWDEKLRRHAPKKVLIKDLTENQKKNFFDAKKFVKDLKDKEKKLKKKP
jgi:hypothetical protein